MKQLLTMPLRADFAVPVDDRYFEDYEPGTTYEYGYVTASEDAIIEFARRYDPQRMHTDPAFAAAGPYRGLISSGWYSIALSMRMLVDHYLSAVASLASPGVDEVRWAVPLRPGDEVRLRVTTLDARVSRSKPDRGIVRSRVELVNQHDECPAAFRAVNFVTRRG